MAQPMAKVYASQTNIKANSADQAELVAKLEANGAKQDKIVTNLADVRARQW